MRNRLGSIRRVGGRFLEYLLPLGLTFFNVAFAVNPLQGPMDRIAEIVCGVMGALAGPFGAALAVLMLGLGFAGLLIGNRNAMGLIITSIAGGALLLGARTLGSAIFGPGTSVCSGGS